MKNLNELFLYLDLGSFFKFSIRIVLACLSGLFIGMERKRRNREAGIRTHMIVILGSCLAMIISKYGFIDSQEFDASRLAAQVISGIGFLGVGIIFVKNYDIKGLTTAAGIWTSSIIGLCYGAGMVLIAIFSTILILIIQIFIFEWLDADQGQIKKIVIVSSKLRTINDIDQFLNNLKIEYKATMLCYEGNDIKSLVEYRTMDKKKNHKFIEYLINSDDVNKFYFL